MSPATTLSKPPLVRIAFTALVACMSTRPLVAIDYTWTGAAGDSFYSASNWDPVGVPNDASDKAIFGLPGTYTVKLIPGVSGDVTVTNKAIEVQRGTVTLDFFNGIHDITYVLEPAVTGAVVADVGTINGQSARLVLSGGFGMVDARGPLQIATVAGSTGRVDLSIDWTGTATTIVGSAGNGTLVVGPSSTLTDSGGLLGGFFTDTGVGTANVQGRWTNNGSLTVGNFGSGTLNIQGGTVSTSGNAVVGRSAGETGVVNLTSDGRWTVGGTLAVGGNFFNGRQR